MTALDFLKKCHGEDVWLKATYKTEYPDAVVLTARLLGWNKKLEHLARAQDPDIAVSATPGWNLRFENIPSADHGYIARESLVSTLMIHGPGVKTGIIETPHRILEITPTVFDMIGYQGQTDFDKLPMQDIYED